MKNIRDYINAIERKYTYRIRMIVPITDYVLERIEYVILKYRPLDMTAPKKTLFQSNPLDFGRAKNAEVYFVDITTSLPASSNTLRIELAKSLGFSEDMIVVRSEDDPMEIETRSLVARGEFADEAEEKDLKKTALLLDPNYTESEDAPSVVDQKYVSRFLNHLNKVKDERNEKMKVDAPNALMKWLDMPKSDVPLDNGTYNDGIDGAMKPNPDAEPAENEVELPPSGAIDDASKTFAAVYTKDGKPVILRRKAKKL